MFHHFFVYVAPPTLGSKLPQQLFDGVGCYLCLCHQENVVFGQVGKIVFFWGAGNSSGLSEYANYSLK